MDVELQKTTAKGTKFHGESYERKSIFLLGSVAGVMAASFEVMANILVVDDDDDIRDLLVAIVQMAGHKVREARNGLEGLKAVANNLLDLVPLDVEMPVLRGPEMAYELFIRNCGLEMIPIIILSGVVGLDEVPAVVGTPYFLGKPYSPEALFKMIDRARLEHVPPRPKLEVQ